MTSAASALQDAVTAALRADAALTALGIDEADKVATIPGPSEALPYLVVGGTTEAFAEASTHSEGSDTAVTVVCWAKQQGLAVRLADAVQAALTDRDSPLTASGFNLLIPFAESLGPPVQEPDTAGAERPAWGCPVRIRYRIYRES